MANEHHALAAFVSVLLAIVLLSCIAAVLAWHGKNVEALGLSGAVTGLIGVAGTFRPRQPGSDATGVSQGSGQ